MKVMKLKKLDIVIIAVLVIMSLVSVAMTLISSNRKFDQKVVVISVKGKVYKTVPLDNHNETFKIQTDLGRNTIQINDGKVHVTDADCHDQICVKDGDISKPGQMLVCLPNKVVIEIKGQNKSDVDGLAY